VIQHRAHNIWHGISATEPELELKLADGTFAKDGQFLQPELLDPRRLDSADTAAGEAEVPRIYQDVFETVAPYYKIPWLEAILGCEIQVSKKSESIWARPYLSATDLAKGGCHFTLREEWIEKLLEFTEYLVERFQGQYMVTQTPWMRGPTDLLSATFGLKDVFIGMHLAPAAIRELLNEFAETFVRVCNLQLRSIPAYSGGYCNAYGLWAPGTSVSMQDDNALNLSPRLYQEFVSPVENEIVSKFDYTTRHPHSMNLGLADFLVGIQQLGAIEVNYDPPPFGPPFEEIIPLLRKIQEKSR
jgi:uroporphyrinogen-III decarboxylase